MNSLRQIMLRGVLLGLLAAVLGAGALFSYVAWYTRSDRILPGVTIAGTPVGGLTVKDARNRLAQVVQQGPVVTAGTVGSGTLVLPHGPEAHAILRWADREWRYALHEFGVAPDLPKAVKQAAGMGREGGLWLRVRGFLGGFVHGYSVPIDIAFREQTITRHLEAIGREIYRPVRNAVYDLEADRVSEHQVGQELDVQASLEAVRQAAAAGNLEAELVIRQVPPQVTAEDLAKVRQYRVSQFRTPILAADPGRVQNISLAVRKISGVVLQPGAIFSFNDTVGPRDAAHGWAQAKELYQGEFVLGYGGGICQVSSTLYNATLLGGLEVKERYHHDRPLQYVEPGRDATVAWQLLDYRFRNNLDVPVMVMARVIEGSPKQIEVSIYSAKPKSAGEIRLEDGDVRYFPPDMVEVKDPLLPENQRLVIDEGYFGIEIKIFRVFRDGNKERRELVSHDRYEPKAGRVKVGVGNAPGAEKLLNPGIQ